MCRIGIMQSRGDRLSRLAEANESNSRFADGHAFLVQVAVRRAGCGASPASLLQMIAGLLQVCYMVRNLVLAPRRREVISRMILDE
jgi:hypothetical protein